MHVPFVSMFVVVCTVQETGDILMPQDLKKSQIYAAKKICFEPEELAQIKSFDKSGE